MAGGKLSPRQKMINLMYLIFIAMLALNMSKEVLSAFGFMNAKLKNANVKSEIKINQAYKGLATKAVEQSEKYADLNLKADKIKKLSDNLYKYIEDIKSKMLSTVEDTTNYESMDKSEVLDQYFFQGGGVSKNGKKFVNLINNYRENLDSILGSKYSSIANEVNERFNTNKTPNKEGKKINWLKYHFEGFPTIASITNLTQMQTDIETTQTDILSAMLKGQLESDVSLTNYQAIVVPDKTAFFQGENFTGKIYLGRKDPTLKAESVEINGSKIKDENIQKGQVLLNFPSGKIGDNEIKGKFVFMENGKPVEIPIESSYAVVPKPNQAVISADKMNVVYRGLDNPMTISIPGISSNNIKASASGLRNLGKGKYIMRPTLGRNVNIKVSGKLPDGKTVSTNQLFRIKDIPALTGTIRGQYGEIIKMPRSSLQKSTVGAALPDFVFDLKIKVTSFSFKVQGKPTVNVNGTRLNVGAIRALSKARRGENIMIFNIKAKLLNNTSYHLKKIAPIIIELTN